METLTSFAYKLKPILNISKSTYFSLPPKQKPQRYYWYQINWITYKNNLQGKCTSWLANNRSLCCKQVINKTAFRSNQTSRIFKIYHNLNCKRKYGINLLERTKSKIQYVGKAETEFNIRLNNHRKDVWKPDAIPASRHSSRKNHNLNTHAKFILI